MNSYIYLIQDGKFINTNIYKIGRTTQKGDTRRLIRFSSYNKETIQKFLREVNTDIVINIEDEIKTLFVKKYKLVQGSEWFEGDCNSMISEINSIIDKHKPLVCIIDKHKPLVCILNQNDNFYIPINNNIKMDLYCELCDYIADNKYYFMKHNKSKKHFNKIINLEIDKGEINKEEIDNTQNKIKIYECHYCNTKIKHQSSYSRHSKKCKNKIDINNNNNNDSELELLKLKNKLDIQDLQHKLEIKDLKLKYLEDNNNFQRINITNINNSNNNINHNISHKTNKSISKSKLDDLNMNYSLMIDMNTFITNFESEIYGLNETDTEKILDICKNGYIEDIIDQFFNYLKNSMMKQCENNNIIYPIGKVKLPFVFGDSSLRYYFEKKNENEWCKTTSTDNIKKLVSIIEKQVYEHKNEHIYLNDYKKRRIVNGLLKKTDID
jgi:hypothetical protein